MTTSICFGKLRLCCLAWCCQLRTWKLRPKNLNSQKKVPVVISLLLTRNLVKDALLTCKRSTFQVPNLIYTTFNLNTRIQNDGLLIKLSRVLLFNWKFNHLLTYSDPLILSHVLWSAGHLATCQHEDLWLASTWPSASIGWLFYNWSNQSERGSDWQSLNPNQWPI